MFLSSSEKYPDEFNCQTSYKNNRRFEFYTKDAIGVQKRVGSEFHADDAFIGQCPPGVGVEFDEPKPVVQLGNAHVLGRGEDTRKMHAHDVVYKQLAAVG